ncbi:MAG: hypothetical protein QOD30_1921, partial [Actinomycetota bacterium]|nr:hypothetical protein [Actinomycetota bacterium]
MAACVADARLHGLEVRKSGRMAYDYELVRVTVDDG